PVERETAVGPPVGEDVGEEVVRHVVDPGAELGQRPVVEDGAGHGGGGREAVRVGGAAPGGGARQRPPGCPGGAGPGRVSPRRRRYDPVARPRGDYCRRGQTPRPVEAHAGDQVVEVTIAAVHLIFKAELESVPTLT